MAYFVCGIARQTAVFLDYMPATQASPCDRIIKTPNNPKISSSLRGLPFLATKLQASVGLGGRLSSRLGSVFVDVVSGP